MAVGTACSTITDFERGARNPRGSTMQSTLETLETAGIIFTDRDDFAGPGLRLRE